MPVTVIGDKKAGKSSLILRLTKDRFQFDEDESIKLDSTHKLLTVR